MVRRIAASRSRALESALSGQITAKTVVTMQMPRTMPINDKSIPNGVDIIRRPVSLKEPKIKGQRYLKTDV